MWVFRFLFKFVLPFILIIFFAWICIAFVWNKSGYSFTDVQHSWFNVVKAPDGSFIPNQPEGVLGKAVASLIPDGYGVSNNFDTSFLSWFKSSTWRKFMIVYVMPVGVSLLFAVLCYTVLSIVYAVVRFIVKKNRQLKPSKN